MASFVTDTLRDVDEAFRSGTLALPTEPGCAAGMEAVWSDFFVNKALTIIFVALAVLYLSRIINLLPDLFAGMTRWRRATGIEESVSLARDRNQSGLVSTLGLALILSRFGIWKPLASLQPSLGLQTLIIIGFMAAYLLFRQALFAAFAPSGQGRNDYFGMGHRAIHNWTTVAAITLGITASAMTICGADAAVTRNVCLAELLFLWADYLLVEGYIFAEGRGLFVAFLYLCGLEILPMAALLATDLIN